MLYPIELRAPGNILRQSETRVYETRVYETRVYETRVYEAHSISKLK
jgi:hypothetical protein